MSSSPSSSNTITISKSRDSKKINSTRTYNNSPSPFNHNRLVEEQINALKKENKELREELVELKVNQFYQLDNTKLKTLINQVEKLKV